jgi:hypothetical protein
MKPKSFFESFWDAQNWQFVESDFFSNTQTQRFFDSENVQIPRTNQDYKNQIPAPHSSTLHRGVIWLFELENKNTTSSGFFFNIPKSDDCLFGFFENKNKKSKNHWSRLFQKP